jgi:RNA polymerase sigma-70 factor (ECF subfamily)
MPLTHLVNQQNEFALLWATAFPRLRVFVLMCVPSYHDAEDVIQETAVAAAAEFPQYDRERPFVSWVLGIARHRVLRHWREKGASRQILFDDQTLLSVESAFSELELNPDPTHEALESCLGKLSLRSRRLIEHRYIQGLDTDQISSRTGMTVQSVYTQLYRIRQALGDCIKRRLSNGESTC